MALPLYALKHIKNTVLPRMPEKPKLAMLSYQDIIAEPNDVGDLFFGKNTITPEWSLKNADAFRFDSDDIKKWHKADWIKGPIIDTKWLFEKLGFEFDCFDIVKARGNEIFLDLNFNLPEQFKWKYDFVFENCMDHVFNISKALCSTYELCKPGGIIFHLNPLCIINHGFYNISPTLYKDFYEQNKCDILKYEAFSGIQKQDTFITTRVENILNRPKGAINKSMQLCIVKKNDMPNNGIKIPTQSKFVNNPMSKL